MTGRISISESAIEEMVKDELGFGQYIDRGLTGRIQKSTMFGEEREFEERAEFSLWEIAEAADVISDDDLYEAARDGIRQWLHDNREELQVKINTQAEIAYQELLSEAP